MGIWTPLEVQTLSPKHVSLEFQAGIKKTWEARNYERLQRPEKSHNYYFLFLEYKPNHYIYIRLEIIAIILILPIAGEIEKGWHQVWVKLHQIAEQRLKKNRILKRKRESHTDIRESGRAKGVGGQDLRGRWGHETDNRIRICRGAADTLPAW